jgi:hypothetical protein
MLIGALLRVPAQAIHRRIIKELNAAGRALTSYACHISQCCSFRVRMGFAQALSPSVPA